VARPDGQECELLVVSLSFRCLKPECNTEDCVPCRSDDQFMGIALISRLAAANATDAALYINTAASMQLSFASYMRDPLTGLFFHGYNYASNETSCCFWGRANGWVLMSHVEVLRALYTAAPTHPLLPQIQTLYTQHVDSMLDFQSADGRWHQVLNDTSTFLETSVTAMSLFALATGVTEGWLSRTKYNHAIQLAWTALAATVAEDGTVSGICAGTGIQVSVADYEARPTDYGECQPGLGSVFRAAHAYYIYTTGNAS
jgi:unsaturated rhamnogalacturonyl hydrolase